MTITSIRKRLDSETLSVPELLQFVGQEVEVTVQDSLGTSLETEETFNGLAPPEPTPEERERNMNSLRESAKTDPVAAAWLNAIEGDVLDVERVIRNRGIQ